MHKKKDINIIYHILQALILGLMIMFTVTYFCKVKSTEVFRESDKNILNCLYCLLFSLIPILGKKWNIHSTKTLQIYFLIAICVHFILGGTLHFYRDVWFFSWIVHLTNSFLIATIIYGMLLRHCKNQSKFFMFLVTVAFTALVGVVWEFCEYAIDGIMTGSNMQRFNDSISNEPFIGRKALQDTMIDLMMDVLGGAMAGLYFAFLKIKGVPLYKFLELKYVKSESTNITYSEDHEVKLKLSKQEKHDQKILLNAKIKRAKSINKAKLAQKKLDKKNLSNNTSTDNQNSTDNTDDKTI